MTKTKAYQTPILCLVCVWLSHAIFTNDIYGKPSPHVGQFIYDQAYYLVLLIKTHIIPGLILNEIYPHLENIIWLNNYCISLSSSYRYVLINYILHFFFVNWVIFVYLIQFGKRTRFLNTMFFYFSLIYELIEVIHPFCRLSLLFNSRKDFFICNVARKSIFESFWKYWWSKKRSLADQKSVLVQIYREMWLLFV